MTINTLKKDLNMLVQLLGGVVQIEVERSKTVLKALNDFKNKENGFELLITLLERLTDTDILKVKTIESALQKILLDLIDIKKDSIIN